MCNKWRASDMKRSRIISNYDCRNAFAATDRTILEASAEKFAGEEDITYAVAAVRQATMSMCTADGTIDIRSTSGSQMGFTTAPRDFITAYNQEVEERRKQEGGHGEQRWFMTSDPRDSEAELVDTSICCFMDDITKSTVVEEGESAENITDTLNQSTA
eukprot:5173136-Pyramimonas_sp.AAC.1